MARCDNKFYRVVLINCLLHFFGTPYPFAGQQVKARVQNSLLQPSYWRHGWTNYTRKLGMRCAVGRSLWRWAITSAFLFFIQVIRLYALRLLELHYQANHSQFVHLPMLRLHILATLGFLWSIALLDRVSHSLLPWLSPRTSSCCLYFSQHVSCQGHSGPSDRLHTRELTKPNVACIDRLDTPE